MRTRLWAAFAVVLLLAAGPASADDVADFYSGRTITIVVAAGPGGAHTKYSQYLAPYVEKYLPGHPKLVTQNMGGAGGTKAANYLYNSAPKDGTYIGILLSDTPFAARLRTTGVKYDPSRFSYLGGADRTRSAFTVLTSIGVHSLADATKRQVIMGSTGKGSQTYTVPTLTNALLGTRFKVITGYRGMGGIYLALERKEIEGFQSVWNSVASLKPDWIKTGLVTVIAANSLDPLPDRPNVPLLKDLVTTPIGKRIAELVGGNGVLGRCWLAPPGVPADRLAALRTAFDKALNDPAAVAGAPARRMTWEPVPWKDLQDQVGLIMSADAAIIDRMRQAMNVK